MNDIRRTILWVIFGFSMVLLWDQWQVHNGRQATFFPGAKPAATATAKAPAAAQPASGAAAVPAAASAAGAAQVPGAAGPATPAAPRERIVVTTDVLRLSFDTEGGAIVRSEFLRHADMHLPQKPFVLLDQSADRVYLAQTGLIGGNFPTHKTPMSVSGERTLREGANELVLKFESPDVGGLRLVKTYTLRRGDYAIGVKHEVVNTGSAPVTPQLYLQLVRDGNKPAGESSFYSTFTGPAVYTEAKKYQKVEFKDIENGKVDIEKSASNGYAAMVQHYFASAWLLADGVQRELFVRKIEPKNNIARYAAGMSTALGEVAPGQTKAVDARLFVGPQVEKTMEGLTPGLELVKDYGMFTILAKPLYWLLDKIHSLLGNWGWSIVGLVLLLKIAFYWLNAKAYASMAKMKAINPKIS